MVLICIRKNNFLGFLKLFRGVEEKRFDGGGGGGAGRKISLDQDDIYITGKGSFQDGVEGDEGGSDYYGEFDTDFEG